MKCEAWIKNTAALVAEETEISIEKIAESVLRPVIEKLEIDLSLNPKGTFWLAAQDDSFEILDVGTLDDLLSARINDLQEDDVIDKKEQAKDLHKFAGMLRKHADKIEGLLSSLGK